MPKLIREKTVEIEIDEGDLFAYLETAADPVSKVVLVRRGLLALTEEDFAALADFCQDSPDNMRLLDFMRRSKDELERIVGIEKVAP